jgi:hypothetical protein
MKRDRLLLAIALAALNGCATLVHGPYEEVRIESDPPGATATISAQTSQRGPLFLDARKQTVTTPATVRLLRDNNYRIELQKPGYKVTTTNVVSAYDWLWAPVACGPCEAVGELPTYDMKEHNAAVRFAEAAFYEYPVGFFRAWGHALRLISPDALLGNAFKLKPKDSGYFENWNALDETPVSARLEPIS